MSFYDSQGNKYVMNIQFTKDDAFQPNPPNENSSWNISLPSVNLPGQAPVQPGTHYEITVNGTDKVYLPVGNLNFAQSSLKFSVDGKLTTVTGGNGTGFDLTNINLGRLVKADGTAAGITGETLTGINVDFAKVTQFNSKANVTSEAKDGNTAGSMTGYSIDGNGIIRGTYSNGQNSGILIDNVSEAGEEITFDINFADTSNLGIWDVLGEKVVSIGSDYNIDIDVVGNKVYTVYSEGEFNKILKSKMYDGSKWITLGDNILNEQGNEPKIKVFNDIPYVLYHDKNYRVTVVKYEDNKWQKVQVLTQGESQYSDMIAGNNGIYVAYTEPYTDILKVSKLNQETNKFELLGESVHSGYIVKPSLSEWDGEVYVSFTDFNKGNKVYVKRYENNKWTSIDGLNVNASSVNIKASNNGIYLAMTPTFDGNGSEAYFYNGSSWNKLGESFADRNAMNIELDVYRGIPYIAYIDSNKISTEVKYFDGETWVNEGMSVSNEKNTNISFKINGGKAYVGINSFNSGNFSVKYKSIGKEIPEDINGDGEIDLLDLSLVAIKYNLQSTDVGFEEIYDLNNDGIIDIFDLIHISKKIS
ncbi:MAG: hypothetical protein KIC47_15555 [Clostridium sp.]|nr:hypothetical protein [Clostridium sp.]